MKNKILGLILLCSIANVYSNKDFYTLFFNTKNKLLSEKGRLYSIEKFLDNHYLALDAFKGNPNSLYIPLFLLILQNKNIEIKKITDSLFIIQSGNKTSKNLTLEGSFILYKNGKIKFISDCIEFNELLK